MKFRDTYAKIVTESKAGTIGIYCSFSTIDSGNNRVDYEISIEKSGIYVHSIESAYLNEYFKKHSRTLDTQKCFGISIDDFFNNFESVEMSNSSLKKVLNSFLLSGYNDTISTAMKRFDILFLKYMSQKLDSDSPLKVFFTVCSMSDKNMTLREVIKPFTETAPGLLHIATRRI